MAGLCGVFGLAGYHGADTLIVAVLAGAITLLSCAQGLWYAVAPVPFAAAGIVLAVTLGLSQLVLGAQPYTGWILATASIMSVTCYFEWPHRQLAAHAVAAATVAGYTAGCVLAGGGFPVVPSVRMVLQALLAWLGLRLILRSARFCDRLSRRAARRRSTAEAARAQRAADSAYLALLHDTASTTFLMVSTAAADDFGWLPGQARRDLEVLTTQSVRERETDLAELLESFDGHMDLDVRLDVRGPIVLPAEAAFAIYHGVREALSNVRKHSGDLRPTVSAHQDGQVEVLVRDRGRGFDPDHVPPHRRGLSDSIRARMTEAGGQVEVTSAAGEGTTVHWTWTRG
ncbi:signal transduction histidine kinase [Herbihabitans rhizosphaerae]|uniref:Signal transduction histidine kinase n=2 Tax=Herbihabitans rhizosphaerae TaxID=1872711 RepID=A0A4Q7KKI6_9PSEU|nr:signal transduction histidine kinase [Herbihabitans rhizosphaerae]